MRREMIGAAMLFLTGGLAAGCNDDEGPAGDGSVSDRGARECSAELFCSNGVVEQEVEGDGGRCLRQRVYTCQEGCKVFSAATTQPALLCNEDPPDSGPPPDRGADGGTPADGAGDLPPAADGTADLAGDLVPADLAGDAAAADAA